MSHVHVLRGFACSNPIRTAGDLPAAFNNLTALNTLHLESTAINTLPSPVLASLGKLATLTLVKNAKMTSDMTSGLASLPLVNLYVRLISSQPAASS